MITALFVWFAIISLGMFFKSLAVWAEDVQDMHDDSEMQEYNR